MTAGYYRLLTKGSIQGWETCEPSIDSIIIAIIIYRYSGKGLIYYVTFCPDQVILNIM